MAQMSPEDSIRHRLQLRCYARQDKALELYAQGQSVQAIARTLDVRAILIRSMVSIATMRPEIMLSAISPNDFDPEMLTRPEKTLLEALVKATFANYERDRTRMPESKHVSFIAGKSSSWASQTARKRIGMPMLGAKDPSEPVAFGLVDVAGNGYMQITNKGWRICYLLFPQMFAWAQTELPMSDVA